MSNDPHTLSKTTRTLHGLVALFIICLLCVGFYMDLSGNYRPMPWHKSFGMLALLVILPRVVWRLIEGWPKPVGHYNALERGLAKITHWVLLIGSLLMPLSGMLMSYNSGRGLFFFGLTLAMPNPDPANPGKVLPLNESLAGLGANIHSALAYLLTVAIVLHVAGAIKHHTIDKDRTLLRMLGR